MRCVNTRQWCNAALVDVLYVFVYPCKYCVTTIARTTWEFGHASIAISASGTKIVATTPFVTIQFEFCCVFTEYLHIMFATSLHTQICSNIFFCILYVMLFSCFRSSLALHSHILLSLRKRRYTAVSGAVGLN